jgi:hypothetical protein
VTTSSAKLMVLDDPGYRRQVYTTCFGDLPMPACLGKGA